MENKGKLIVQNSSLKNYNKILITINVFSVQRKDHTSFSVTHPGSEYYIYFQTKGMSVFPEIKLLTAEDVH